MDEFSTLGGDVLAIDGDGLDITGRRNYTTNGWFEAGETRTPRFFRRQGAGYTYRKQDLGSRIDGLKVENVNTYRLGAGDLLTAIVQYPEREAGIESKPLSLISWEGEEHCLQTSSREDPDVLVELFMNLDFETDPHLKLHIPPVEFGRAPAIGFASEAGLHVAVRRSGQGPRGGAVMPSGVEMFKADDGSIVVYSETVMLTTRVRRGVDPGDAIEKLGSVALSWSEA